MQSYIESKIVEFKAGDRAGYCVHHFGFAAVDDAVAIEAMELLITSGIIDSKSINDTESEDGTKGFIFSWYSAIPLTPAGPTGWPFCDKHEYSEYQSEILGRDVCYTCDPFSENNAHRPVVDEWVKKIRRRIEDHLRKSEVREIFIIARNMGVKLN
jgi:hypothetical protein